MIYSVSSELYAEVASRLGEAIGSAEYFSRALEFDFEGTTCRFVASLLVYREPHALPEGSYDAVANLVPVWWEFHTTADEGERLNDFSFACLVPLLCVGD